MRATAPVVIFDSGGTIQAPPWEVETKRLKALILVASIFLSIFAGSSGSGQWEDFLLLTNASSFSIADPLFNKDVSFYIFSLPFLTHIYSSVMFMLVISLYLIRRSFRFIPPKTWQVAPLFWGTFGVWLELNEILFAKRGVVFGPGYTEVTTQLWVLKAMIVVCAFCGFSLIYYAFRPDWRIPTRV